MRLLLALFTLLATSGFALPQSLTQGGFYIGQTSPQATIKFDGKTYRPTPSGTFILGFARDAELEQSFEICEQNHCQATTLLITPRTFKTQIIKGVPANTVNPDPKETARAAADTKAITASRSKATDADNFSAIFAEPVRTYTTTGVFGSRRTYNGEERNWHKGLDFAAPTGTPVYAPAGAKVVLARNTFFNGNLIILDHGSRLFSLYAHLDRMSVKVGDTVTEGQQIGAIGTTGRSTGPHLHWGVNWGNLALDPALFLRTGTEPAAGR